MRGTRVIADCLPIILDRAGQIGIHEVPLPQASQTVPSGAVPRNQSRAAFHECDFFGIETVAREPEFARLED